jgi:prolyl 4-hydroxylase
MFNYNNKIITINNFLLFDECDKFIYDINNNQNIIPFTNSGIFKNNKYINANLSNYFYQKIENKLKDNNINISILRPNNLIMTGKYTNNQEFGLHTDTGLYYNKETNEKSRYTLLIYLNDNFNGGETEFYDDNFNSILKIIPKKGKALLFDIDMWHKGNQLIHGEKYWIGCEIISNF